MRNRNILVIGLVGMRRWEVLRHLCDGLSEGHLLGPAHAHREAHVHAVAHPCAEAHTHRHAHLMSHVEVLLLCLQKLRVLHL